MKTVIMRQVSSHKWQLETPRGEIMKDQITANNDSEAREFVTRYISSFSDWDYELAPMMKETTKVFK